MKRAKLIISEEEPPVFEAQYGEGQPPVLSGVAGIDTGFLWFKPSISRFFKAISTNPIEWEEARVSGELGDIDFIGTVSADGSAGLTGQKTIAGYTFTFKKGLLVGFQAP